MLVSDYIIVDSIYDRWILSPTYKGRRVALYHENLYHENNFHKPPEEPSIYDDYHSQNKTFRGIVKTLQYIHGHDKFRSEKSIYIESASKIPSWKGTKRCKSAQKRTKKAQKSRAIWNVLSIIDSFNYEKSFLIIK